MYPTRLPSENVTDKWDETGDFSWSISGMATQKDSTNHSQPLLVSLRAAAQLLSVSRSTITRMVADGSIPTRRLRDRTLIPMQVLEQLAKVE